MESPPSFFYNPNAYTLGIIEKKAIDCQCCGQARAYHYTGNLYCLENVDSLCPWCIADGSTAKKYDGAFVASFEGLNPNPTLPGNPMSAATMAQVSNRTPGYASWQDDWWLGHCADACIFLGYVGSQELRPVWEEVRSDAVTSGWGEENIRDHMHKDGDMTGYLFQCQHCGKHRLHVEAN